MKAAKIERVYPQIFLPRAAGQTITPELIQAFLEEMEEKGLRAGTVGTYRAKLESLYHVLPQSKQIVPDTLAKWKEHLLEEGYAPRTVNLAISTANNFLSWLGRRDLQLTSSMDLPDDALPELTRKEYLRLLQTARNLEDERGYLLVKVFATTGLNVQDLSKLTVESVREGRLAVSPNRCKRLVRLPDCLQAELSHYIQHNQIAGGPVFRTRGGTPLSRSVVTKYIRDLCHDARVDENKGNPRCLRKLYLETLAGIEVNISLLIEQAHDRLLETEQLTIGWPDDGPGG